MKTQQSGKAQFRAGLMRYVFEELKTMNAAKFKSLLKIVSGYFSMKRETNRERPARPPKTFHHEGSFK